jgi:hypothetical protein
MRREEHARQTSNRHIGRASAPIVDGMLVIARSRGVIVDELEATSLL